ncbi:MAG: hypothetical protein ABFD69_08900 [Candidatus Sumerlaeia bacterium]
MVAIVAMQGQAWGCAYCRFCIEANHYLFGWFAALVASIFILGLMKKFRAEFWDRQRGRLFLIPIAIFVVVYLGIGLALKYSRGNGWVDLLLKFPVPAGGDSILGHPEELSILGRIQALVFILVPLVGAFWIRQKWLRPVWARVPCSLAVLILPCYLVALGIASAFPGRGIEQYSHRIDIWFLIFKVAAVAFSVLSIKTRAFQFIGMGLVFALLSSDGPASPSIGLPVAAFLLIFIFKMEEPIVEKVSF